MRTFRSPLLLGHRGARVPSISENTFAAFDYCLVAGCHGFEFDVRLTGDGRAMVCHDEKIRGLRVDQETCAELQERCKSKASIGGAGLCLLENVLEHYGQGAFLDIELKVSGLTSLLIEALQQFPPQHGYVVSSFLPTVLLDIHQQDDEIPLGLIADCKPDLELWSELPVDYVIPHYRLASIALIRNVHGAGKKVLVWTVNRPADMLRLRDWDVDGMIADDPELFSSTMGPKRGRSKG